VEGEGREGRGGIERGMGRERGRWDAGGRLRGRARKMRESTWGKEERGLDFDICPGAPQFLVTPLLIGRRRDDVQVSKIGR